MVGMLASLAAATLARITQERGRADRASEEKEMARRLMVTSLLSLTEVRDADTGRHSRRIQQYSRLLAQEMSQHPMFRDYLTPERIELLASLAPLHDIGKVGVPDAVLQKPGKLTDEERSLAERHTEYGYEILAGSGDELVELAATVALNHHERPDGKGYPRGLVGEEIPLPGRIAAVADVFDALTNDRVYRPAYTVDEALRIMKTGRGTQFDARVFDAFLEAVEEIAAIGRRLPDQPAESGVPARERDSDRDPTRVLIVEDHEAVGRGLELLLRREGMEIAGTAPTLAVARTLLQRRRPHVVILDVDLGARAGWTSSATPTRPVRVCSCTQAAPIRSCWAQPRRPTHSGSRRRRAPPRS
jgi:HD-GYP domain-containing protein (c-di-GMP phosphodiesterase class II)